MIVYCLEIQSFFWGFFRPLLTFQFQSGRPFCTPIGLRNMYSNNGGDRSKEGFGKMGYGCKHYRRRCLIRAPCCNEIFSCRHCHNESTATSDKHEIPRHDVRSVICLICDTEQKVVQLCSNCGVNMGEYFCDVCKFYDDNIEKSQYHCFDCGICRVGGKNNYFHCLKCGSCYSNILFEDHVCVENSMKCHCPICYEYLFDSLREVNVLKCGHTIHSECLTQMEKHKHLMPSIYQRTSRALFEKSLIRYGFSVMIAMTPWKLISTFLATTHVVTVTHTTPGLLILLYSLNDYCYDHTKQINSCFDRCIVWMIAFCSSQTKHEEINTFF